MNFKNTTIIFSISSLLLPLISFSAGTIGYIDTSSGGVGAADDPLSAKCINLYSTNTCTDQIGVVTDECVNENTLSEIVSGALGTPSCRNAKIKTYYCDAYCNTLGYTTGSCINVSVACPSGTTVSAGACSCSNTSSPTYKLTSFNSEPILKFPKKNGLFFWFLSKIVNLSL